MSTPTHGSLDLPAEEQARILRKTAELERQNYWEILGLSGDPTASDIKRAYFELSKQFHPDRHFGKNLGVFKDHLTKIFQALKRAYDTLADETTQQAYRKKHLPPRPPASTEELEAHRQRILAERKKKRFARPAVRAPEPDQEQSAEACTLGMRHLGAGQHVEAATAFKNALVHDPNNEQAKALLTQVEQEIGLKRATRLAERGESEAAEGRPDAGALALCQAFELSPQKPRYGVRAMELFIEAHQPKKALPLGAQLLAAAPQLLEARLAYALALGLSGEPKQAMALLAEVGADERQDSRVTKLSIRLAKLSSE